MSERPPFDAARAAFWLLAGVLLVHGFAVGLGLIGCFLYAWPGGLACDVGNKLGDLLAAGLAAALAFSNYRSKE